MQGSSTGSFAPGQVLAGKYRVERVLGSGGMGVVVAATHLELDERVAVKFLNAQGLRSQEVLARFSQEARAASKIKNEHVVRTLDVGRLENGVPYLVMEYLDGADLQTRLATQGPLRIDRAIDYVLQACEALVEAHSLGIIHRDLKPANLFVAHRPDGTECVKVLDFGISKVTRSSGAMPVFNPAMTAASSVMGSPLYLSPEQTVSARSADARSDIWALGITLHELLTGAAPFQSTSLPELYFRIQTQPAPPLRNQRPDAPERLQQLVCRCLEKQPEARFQGISDLAVALAEFAPPHALLSVDRIVRLAQVSSGLATGISVAGPASEFGYGAASTAGSWAHSQTSTGRPRTGVWVSLGVGVIALGAVGVGVALRIGSATRERSASPLPASASADPVEMVVAPELEVPPPAASSATAPPPARSAATARPSPAPTPVPTPRTPRSPDPNSLFRDRH